MKGASVEERVVSTLSVPTHGTTEIVPRDITWSILKDRDICIGKAHGGTVKVRQNVEAFVRCAISDTSSGY